MVNPGKAEGRDGHTGSRGKFRPGWSLATLPGVAEVPLSSAGFLAKPLSVLTRCLTHIYSLVHHYPSFIHGARHSEAQPSAQAHTARQ